MLRDTLPRHLSGALIVLSFLLVLAVGIEASDNSTVNFGANSNITAHSTCKKVTNNSGTGLSVYVPTQTSGEWSSFYMNPPAGVTARNCGPAATTTVTLTSGTAWTVPDDWNPTNNTIEVYGGGGGGHSGQDGGTNSGGGGGAYSRINNLVLTPGASVSYSVGGGGAGGPPRSNSDGAAGGDTWFLSTGTVLAKGGLGGGMNGHTPYSAAYGGQASSGVGTVRYSGGSSGIYGGGARAGGGGGGGAAGPNGNGGTGGNYYRFTPGAGGASGGGYGGYGGYGGVLFSTPGRPGNAHGGGGGGGTGDRAVHTGGGAGAPGIIVITYGP